MWFFHHDIWKHVTAAAFITSWAQDVLRHCYSESDLFSGLCHKFHCYTDIQFNSLAHLCPTLGNPMDCSMPVFPVLHQLPEFAQTYVHPVGGAIQPFHPQSFPSPPTFNLSQHQGLFQWLSSSHQVAKVLEFQLPIVLPMNIQDWFPLGLIGWISLQSKGLSRVFSNTTVQKHQFFGTQLFL